MPLRRQECLYPEEDGIRGESQKVKKRYLGKKEGQIFQKEKTAGYVQDHENMQVETKSRMAIYPVTF